MQWHDFLKTMHKPIAINKQGQTICQAPEDITPRFSSKKTNPIKAIAIPKNIVL